MAEIRAFRAIRYDLGRVGALSDVVAPPYDVIDARLQDELYARSPHNVIRLILNKDEPGDSERSNRYTRASRTLREWKDQGILTQDSARALYVYHQHFEFEGRRHTRRAFLASVRLEPLGHGQIYAHEETLAGPKEDRLRLFRSTRMNLSPVFGLYPDDGSAQRILDDFVGRTLPLEAMDPLGVCNRLWRVTSESVVSAVTGMMDPKPVFIADGHHRYESAIRYLEERQNAGEATAPDAPCRFVLMALVSTSDEGLLILPTHRLISGVGAMHADRLRDLVEDSFIVEAAGAGESGARRAWEHAQQAGPEPALALGTAADHCWQVARYRGGMEQLRALAPHHSNAWLRLPVSLLHTLVLGRLRPTATLRYVHRVEEAMQACAHRDCDLAVLVPACGMDSVAQIASGLEKMPPKSTYFYPKLLSGLVFHSL